MRVNHISYRVSIVSFPFVMPELHSTFKGHSLRSRFVQRSCLLRIRCHLSSNTSISFELSLHLRNVVEDFGHLVHDDLTPLRVDNRGPSLSRMPRIQEIREGSRRHQLIRGKTPETTVPDMPSPGAAPSLIDASERGSG